MVKLKVYFQIDFEFFYLWTEINFKLTGNSFPIVSDFELYILYYNIDITFLSISLNFIYDCVLRTNRKKLYTVHINKRVWKSFSILSFSSRKFCTVQQFQISYYTVSKIIYQRYFVDINLLFVLQYNFWGFYFNFNQKLNNW